MWSGGSAETLTSVWICSGVIAIWQSAIPQIDRIHSCHAVGPVTNRPSLIARHQQYAAGMSPHDIRILIVVVIILGILLARIVVMLRRQDVSGYRFGKDVVARCRAGHLFTTTWIPFVSFKAVRLGLVRFQYCPVGRHMAFVTLVRDSDLSEGERWLARQYSDGRLP